MVVHVSYGFIDYSTPVILEAQHMAVVVARKKPVKRRRLSAELTSRKSPAKRATIRVLVC